jgi:GDP-4-dehydro-6-deoxy-D-mannose reductase
MHTLITGVNGFVGGHLAEALLRAGGWQVWGLGRSHALALPHLREHIGYVRADLCDAAHTSQIIADIQPQVIFHLAGQSFVPASFRDPAATLRANTLPLLHMLLAIIEQRLTCRVLVVGSNEAYGMVQPHDMPIDEDTPLRPATPYGVSKVAQDMLALQYYQSHKLDVVRVRPFNHIGPRQDDRFVAASFARQVAEIEQGSKPPIMHVGTLDVQRDFTDVRDMVRAYLLAVEHGEAGAVYNLGSGQPVAIQSILDTLLQASTATVTVQPDPERIRPVNVPLVACDASRFQARTGWQPRISLQQTLHDILQDWRERLQSEPSPTS